MRSHDTACQTVTYCLEDGWCVRVHLLPNGRGLNCVHQDHYLLQPVLAREWDKRIVISNKLEKLYGRR